MIGSLGYVSMPTAPPRMLGLGFSTSLTQDGLVQLAANPYAAMPSLHAADSLIVGIVLAIVCRRWWAKAFLGDLAGLGLVRGHGHRQPLLARLHRGRRGRAGGDDDRLPARPAPAASLPLSERRRPPADAQASARGRR